MKKCLSALLVFFFLTVTLPASAFAYRYISATEVKQNLAEQKAMSLVDIQVKDEFDQHHIINAQATYAYPVKSAEERARLDPIITSQRSSQDIVVVVCPRGAGGAKRAYDYLQQSGISEERLFILEKGQAEWPYPELLETSN